MLPGQSAVYYPEELSLLGQILDQAVQSLPLNMRTPQNRAVIAKNILACAATGQRDPIELGLAALTNLKVTVSAKPIKDRRRTAQDPPLRSALGAMVLRYRRDGLQSGSHPQADCSNGMSLSGVMKMTQKYAKLAALPPIHTRGSSMEPFRKPPSRASHCRQAPLQASPSRSFFYFSYRATMREL